MTLPELIDFYLIAPFSYDFMQRALLVALMVACVCAMFSCFLVLKGWSLMGDAVSHAVLPGIVIAYAAGLPMALGAFAAGLFCAAATGFLKDNSRIKEDAVMGIVFSGLFALGLVLLTKIETDVHIMHILFGNLLGASWQDIGLTALITLPCLAVMLVKWRDFMLYCFDPAQARVSGLSVRLLHFGMLALLSLTIVASLKAAGIILVVAMLIAPGATGFLAARTFGRMMAVSLCVSLFSCVAGTLLSYHIDADTAPLIVVMQAMIFLAVLLRHVLRKAPSAPRAGEVERAALS